MFERRQLLAIAAGSLVLPFFAATQSTPTAPEQLNELGPENAAISQRVGPWDATQTARATSDDAPVVTTGMVAERRMIGSILQETLRESADPSSKILRIDYLTYNRLEGSWEYLSMDTRAQVGLMPATSFGRDQPDRIEIVFEALALPGSGSDISGRMIRVDRFIMTDGPNRDAKDHYVLAADGTGTEWLGNEYAHTRRS